MSKETEPMRLSAKLYTREPGFGVQVVLSNGRRFDGDGYFQVVDGEVHRELEGYEVRELLDTANEHLEGGRDRPDDPDTPIADEALDAVTETVGMWLVEDAYARQVQMGLHEALPTDAGRPVLRMLSKRVTADQPIRGVGQALWRPHSNLNAWEPLCEDYVWVFEDSVSEVLARCEQEFQQTQQTQGGDRRIEYEDLSADQQREVDEQATFDDRRSVWLNEY